MLMEERQRLATVVKGVHKYLRRKYRENKKDLNHLWKEHTLNKKTLELYAQAMHNLATRYWAVHPETRIHWCRKVAMDYFIGKGLRVALEKDAKRKFFQDQRCSVASSSNQDDYILEASFHLAWQAQMTQINVVHPGKIRLLDVGSCYNPFLQFEEFETFAVDLCPATEQEFSAHKLPQDPAWKEVEADILLAKDDSSQKTVHECDFLQLSTTCSLNKSSSLTYPLHDILDPVKELPSESFHLVVFSLLLEYLPSPLQRLECCKKAWALLAINGLLLIITPDSHSQHRNAPMVKSWKTALESLGFLRWRYEKKEHIHCMAFRKVMDASSNNSSIKVPFEDETLASMIYIPQDFTNACYDDVAEELAASADESKDTECNTDFLFTAFKYF